MHLADTLTKPALDDLWRAVEAFDQEALEQGLDGLFDGVPLGSAVTGVLLPFLAEIGDRWESGELSVAHEHFVSNLVRQRLVLMAAVTPPQELAGTGPVVLLACPPAERHDMVLLCFALLLREQGVRARFLGADTPVPALVASVRTAGADAVVLAATRTTALIAQAAPIGKLSKSHAVYVAGRGATPDVATLLRARVLPEDPVHAVEVVLSGSS